MERPFVLVVEDEAAVRDPLARFLALHGFEVRSAATAPAALEILAEQRPDAAVIDLRLPEGSGRDVIRSIPPPIPVIIFSAVPHESERLEQTRPNTRLVLIENGIGANMAAFSNEGGTWQNHRNPSTSRRICRPSSG